MVVIDKTDGPGGYTYSCGCKDGANAKSGYMKSSVREHILTFIKNTNAGIKQNQHLILYLYALA